MPSKGTRTRNTFLAGDPDDPHGMHHFMRRYFEDLVRREYSPLTIDGQRRHLNALTAWCEARDITRPGEVTAEVVESYQRHLMHRIDGRGKTASFHNQSVQLGTLRVFFKWLRRREHIERNPTEQIEMPQVAKRLPRHILSPTQVEDVLGGPNVLTALGVRDRAMLETFYSTGVRRMELARLTVADVDRERRVVTVRQGKGRKDRVIPIGQRALAWVARYLDEVRPRLMQRPDRVELFLTKNGNELDGTSLSMIVKRYLTAAGLHIVGGCHLLRHAMATHMLEGGADVRFIQEMLGHDKLESTQIYTRVSIQKLQEVHTRTHPARWGEPSSEPAEGPAEGPDEA
jgi:integrase/recombinase XerD